jgi:hypothetical protein
MNANRKADREEMRTNQEKADSDPEQMQKIDGQNRNRQRGHDGQDGRQSYCDNIVT